MLALLLHHCGASVSPRLVVTLLLLLVMVMVIQASQCTFTMYQSGVYHRQCARWQLGHRWRPGLLCPDHCESPAKVVRRDRRGGCPRSPGQARKRCTRSLCRRRALHRYALLTQPLATHRHTHSQQGLTRFMHSSKNVWESHRDVILSWLGVLLWIIVGIVFQSVHQVWSDGGWRAL